MVAYHATCSLTISFQLRVSYPKQNGLVRKSNNHLRVVYFTCLFINDITCMKAQITMIPQILRYVGILQVRDVPNDFLIKQLHCN